MEWYSPNREFKFVINRYENYYYNLNYNYIIQFDIYNNLNILLLQLKFSEIDIAIMFYYLELFIYDRFKNNIFFKINPNNLRMEYNYLYFEKSINDIIFKIYQESIIQNKMINIIQFDLSYIQFENFICDILLMSIIDIDINFPDELINIKEKINILKDVYKDNSS